MKIDSSVIGMESAGSYRASRKTVKRFAITDYRENNEKMQKNPEQGTKETGDLKEHQSRMSVSLLSKRVRYSDNTENEIRQMTVRYIFELLFAQRRGRFKEWLRQQNPELDWGKFNNTENNGVLQSGKLSVLQESIYEEEQSLSFDTVGRVLTSDGRTIEFGINLKMTSSFKMAYREELALTAVQLCDPIVIHYDTDAVSLSDQTFIFDLDMDGKEDRLHKPEEGSGFLALDKNENGIIEDGSELFGAKSGDGFRELGAYDEDHNGWIDENDAVFDKLKIWCPDENGGGSLYTLKEKGIGAICLQRAQAAYDFKDYAGNLKGRVQSTGVFLYENGDAGILQQIDLAKQA